MLFALVEQVEKVEPTVTEPVTCVFFFPCFTVGFIAAVITKGVMARVAGSGVTTRLGSPGVWMWGCILATLAVLIPVMWDGAAEGMVCANFYTGV